LKRKIMTTKEILYRQIRDAVVAFEEKTVGELAQRSLDEGYDPVETIFEGISAGMTIVGDLFEKHEYFVPEVLMCADAMQVGLDILQPHLPRDGRGHKGQVVLGTVQGDVHTIGKDIVKLMLDLAGFTVHDLGKDVPLKKFAEETKRTGSEVVALSAMMTTTMMGMKTAVKMIRESNPEVAIMLGGAPLTMDIVNLFGADGYAKTAARVVEEAEKMVQLFKDRKAGLHTL
jgi:corrinoid protein of di/trimethylamine methyltransferase